MCILKQSRRHCTVGAMNLHLIILMAQLIQDVMVNEDSCYSASTEISLQ